MSQDPSPSGQTPRDLAPLKAELAERIRAIIHAWWGDLPPQNESPGNISYLRTNEFLSALTGPVSEEELLQARHGFVVTMMGYENNVLGLEEQGRLPPGFAVATFNLLGELSPPLPVCHPHIIKRLLRRIGRFCMRLNGDT